MSLDSLIKEQAGSNALVRCHAVEGPTVDLFGLVRSLKEQGLQTPCLFRFPDIVNERMTQLQGCFDKAIGRYEYQVSTHTGPACFHWYVCVANSAWTREQ